MPARFRPRLSYANVISTLCLFLVVGGGAWAATKLPANSVGTKQLENGAVTSSKVKDHSLRLKDIKEGQMLGPAQARALFLGKNDKAADATRLGGLLSTQFARGPGRLLFVRKDAGGAGSATLLDSPTLGQVTTSCLDPPSAGGQVNYNNTTAGTTEVMLDDHANSAVQAQRMGPNPNVGLISSLSMPNHITLQIGLPSGSAGALLEIGSFVSGGKCVWQVSGIVRG